MRSYNYNALATNPHPARQAGTAVKHGRFQRLREKVSIKRTIFALLIVILGIGGFLGAKFVYETHKVFGGSILGILSTTKLKGEDSGRVNILLAGNSSDDVGHDGAQLTDSIMIVSIDTKDNTAFLLSVPRDLYVDIPGAGHQKINDAYVVGQNQNFSDAGYPAGGMGLLEEVLSEDFGITINYYALIDYSAFRDAVNAVGGIQVNIQSSDPRGLYDPSKDYATRGPLVKLTNGVHTLNGEQALDLARARGDAPGSYGFMASDFERTQNQRLMLSALKDKAITAGVLANPAKLSSLSSAFGNNVKTDMKLSEVHRLYDLIKPIGGNSIASLSLNQANGKNLLASYTTPEGQSSLIPAAGIDNYDDIQAFLQQQTSTNPIIREGAQVVVLNGTDTNGLASKARTKLTDNNISVAAVADARTNSTTTSIIDTSGGKFPATSKLLQKLLGNHLTTTNPYKGIYNADFIVIIGNDNITNLQGNSSSSTSGQ